ncbi:MAG: alpha/beta hydrolase [Acidobacteriia bacterium]|nr:alpha/beta hydrolase [Terriglobia bacterium]
MTSAWKLRESPRRTHHQLAPRKSFDIRFLLLFLAAGASGCTQKPASPQAPTPRVQFVTVEPEIRLEVIDWGGTGRNVVLLAGSGNSAHIFDEFAPKLAAFSHVYGITRRGYGASSHPESGYSEQRLAADVLGVLDQLKIAAPVLVGHSMAGEELTRLGAEHSDRLAGLVYIDAASDPSDWPGSSPEYIALYSKLPAPMRDHPGPSPSDTKSFQAYREWQTRSGEVAFPESELRSVYTTNADGSMGRHKTDGNIHRAIGEGAEKRDYSKIRVPVLALFPVSSGKPYQPRNAQERAAIAEFDTATDAYVNRWKKNLQSAPGGVRVVNIPKANHYMFLSNPDDLLRELRTFIAGLPKS